MEDEQTVVYKPTAGNSKLRNKVVVLAFHGGCFSGGSTSWDSKQNAMLANMGFEVHQLAFPKTYPAFVAWARQFSWGFVQDNNTCVVCLGRSSGGYLASLFAALHKLSKLVLLCPVLDPHKRAVLLSKFEKPTRAFFGTNQSLRPAKIKLEPMQLVGPARSVLVVLAHDDGNVPLHLYSPAVQKAALFPGPRTHQGVLCCTSAVLQKAIQKFVLS
jgi:acetyl esterase/lipase